MAHHTPMSPEMLKMVTTVAEHLEGTCKSLSEGIDACDLDPELENDLTFCHGLDELVLCCSFCSWWWEAALCDGEHDVICPDCATSNEEE